MALRSIADIEEKVAGAVSLYNTSVAESERIASVSLFGSYAKRLLMVSTHKHPDNELKYAAKTRDVYAHGYFTLSFDTVYKTDQEDYPGVKLWIEELLA